MCQEVVGTWLALHACIVFFRENNDQVVIDLAKCIVKNKIDEKFAEEVDFIKGEVDFSLMRQWGRTSKHMKPWIWLSAYSVQCSLCMDKVLLEAVIASKSNLSAVMGQLKTICATLHLGQSMFSFCQGLINNEKFHKEITDLIGEVRDADFSEEAIEQWKAMSSAKILSLTSGGQVASKAEFQCDLYGA